MRIQRIEHRHYRVPFRIPFTTSGGLQHQRQGIFVRVTTDDGLVGVGEAAPLPTFGTGEIEDLDARLTEVAREIEGQTLDETTAIIDRVTGDLKTAPACFALDTAILDIRAQVEGVPLARYLSADAVDSVPVNATISDIDADGAATAASYATMAGYSAIKMKVGTIADPGREIERVAAVREAIGSQTELRLDANGAWTYQQAVRIARQVEQYDIAYLEQPMSPRDLAGSARLREDINIRIALDEAATNADAVRHIIELGAADTLIFKPNVIGGLRSARELLAISRKAGLDVVVTTSIEAGIGITAALHFAATLPPPVPACGLATGSLLESDLLVQAPEITGGRMYIPQSAGLGVEIVPEIWESDEPQ